MTTYKQARADHEYLWAIDEAYDMTGGYVDSDDLKKLLQSPTKVTARECYIDQIYRWFAVGPADGSTAWRNDPEVMRIADRYGCDILEKTP